jgi:hypothetical protein
VGGDELRTLLLHALAEIWEEVFSGYDWSSAMILACPIKIAVGGEFTLQQSEPSDRIQSSGCGLS